MIRRFAVASLLVLASFVAAGEASVSADPGDAPATLLDRESFPDGTVLERWKINGETVVYSGPPGGGIGSVEVTENSMAATSYGPPDQMQGQAVAAEVLSARITRKLGQKPLVPDLVNAASVGDRINSWCIGWTHADGDDIHYQACNVRYLAQAMSNGVRYITEEPWTTGYSSDSGCLDCDRLTFLGVSVNENDDNLVVKASPTSTTTITDNCRNVSSSVTFNGATYSQSEEVCDESTHSPWHTLDDEWGAVWKGDEDDKNHYVSALADFVVKQRSGYTCCAHIYSVAKWR